MKRILPLLALLTCLCASARGATTALSFTFNSDAVPTVTGSALTGSLALNYTYLETVDDNGDPLSTPSFRVDPTAPSILVSNPSAVGYGTDIDGKALDAVDQAVLMSFSAPQNISAFSVKLDNSSFGTPFGTAVEFYSDLDVLLYSIVVDQTVGGFTVNDSSLISGVSKIVLPAGALYDNLGMTTSASAVPEPSRVAFAGLGLVGLMFRRRRA